MATKYLMQENGFKLLLEDASGVLMLEQSADVALVQPTATFSPARAYVDSFQFGRRENPARIKW